MKITILLYSAIALSNTATAEDTLEEAVTAALEYDSRVDEAWYGYQAALESRSDALSYRLPKINGVGSFAWLDTKDLNSSGSLQRDGRRSWIGLEVTQPLFSFGRNDARTDMSLAEIGAALENVRGVRQNVVMETVTAWYDLYKARATLAALDEHEKDLKTLLDATIAQQEQSLVTSTEVALVNSRWQQAVARREQASADLTRATNALWKLTGREDFSPEGSIDPTPPGNMPMSLDEAVASSESMNPSTGRARMEYEEARARTRLVAGERYGEMSLKGSWNNGRISGTATGERQVGVQFSMPLYDGGRSNSKLRRAKREREQARSRFEHQQREAEQAVRQAWSSLRAARNVKDNWEKALSAEEKSLAGIQARVDEQLDPLLVLLEARDEMIGVRLEAIRAESAWGIARYQMLASTGTLLNSFDLVLAGSDQTSSP